MNESTPVPPRRSVKLYLLLGLMALGLAFGAYRYLHKPVHFEVASRLRVDLRQPEMLLTTQNLAELPKDVAAAPLLAGLVDEQLVFYYEEDEARLSLEGSLRRLAYEHDLDLQDRFLASLLAAPAEIGLWRSGKGRPEHFVAMLERGALAKFAEALARIVLDDKQLKQAGKFSANGAEVTLYTLDYGGGRTLAFAGRGDHWVVLSDPRLALGEEGELTEDARSILGDLLAGKHPWQTKLPPAGAAKHSFVIGPTALTLGYGHFLPALTGLRLDHDKAWQASLRLDNQWLPALDTAPIWRSIPLGAAFCAALPVDWKAAGEPLSMLLDNDPALHPALAALDPVAAACWYPDSRLAAPLLVARAARELPPETAPLLAKLAEKSWKDVAASPNPGGSGEILSARIPSRHGLRPAGGGDRAFPLALARQGPLIFFSPDRRQVDAALAVAAKRAPALGDEAGLKGSAWLVLDPPLAARLVRAEVQEVLPTEEESFFRDVARTRLWPRLETWGKRQTAFAAVPGPAGADGFILLDLKPLKGGR